MSRRCYCACVTVDAEHAENIFGESEHAENVFEDSEHAENAFGD